MIVLRWSPLPAATLLSYNVFRSIVGFSFDKVPLATIDTKTLELKLNGGLLQTFTFNSTDEIVDVINATISGGQAFESADTTKVFVRSDIREAPGSVEVVGGTALPDFMQTARLIEEKTEVELIENVPALPDPNSTVEFEDPDGVPQDFYAISTIDSMGAESKKSNFKQSIDTTGPLCIVEGIIINLQGERIPDAEVVATLLVPPEAGDRGMSALANVTKKPITKLSGPDGRFCIALLQNSLVELRVDEIGFTHNVRIPNKSFAFINDLVEDSDYRYPLSNIGKI